MDKLEMLHSKRYANNSYAEYNTPQQMRKCNPESADNYPNNI